MNRCKVVMTQPKIKSLFYISRLLVIILYTAIASPAYCESLLREDALEYRQRGYQAQKAGMLAEALSFYQKAIQIDPGLAAVYNDLGVVYETLGQIERAREAYSGAVAVDPGYGKAYFNLALLYEGGGDLRKASEYWLALIHVKDQEQSMLRMAQDRLSELGEIFPEIREQYLRSEAEYLNKEFAMLKDRWALDDKELAKFYIENAGILVKKNDYPKALRLYLNAKHLDPQNDQIDTLIETTQRKILLL